ncbi:hypothetical protein EV132_12233 [Rhizobium sullae]|uniref:Uncharacterized protein n=2 Tax=Rhizobium sullae TaxID=50338 RepID=A0A4R3PT60_RHISU|nr:hypothetical protein EV132_12233 [Rhizobium sullae]
MLSYFYSSDCAWAETEQDQLMAEDDPELTALFKAVAESPKRDNSAYHKALAEARQAFEAAERALGGAVRVQTKTKMKRNGDYVVKWTFKRNTSEKAKSR